MPFSLTIPLSSRAHTLGIGIHETCFPESRTAIQADSASTSVGGLHSIGSGQFPVGMGCDPQQPCSTWATNPSELRDWGQIKGSHLGKAGILSVPVAHLIATGVLYRRSDTISACLFPSRRTLEQRTLVPSAGMLIPRRVVILPDTEVTFGSSHGSCGLLLLILQG